jgi:hypothetical protein
MKRRLLEALLRKAGCEILSESGSHTKWGCDCGGKHTAPVPRHKEISAGVVGTMREKMPCLPEDWMKK